jgi:hypothetical protein
VNHAGQPGQRREAAVEVGDRSRPGWGSERVAAFATVAGLAGAVGALILWGRRLTEADPRMPGTGNPWFGHWGWTVPLSGWYQLVPCLAVAAAIVWWWPELCRRLPARCLPVASAATGLAWAVALAATRGWTKLNQPLLHDADYLFAVDQVGSPAQLLGRYVAELDSFPIHVQGHPPGQLLLLWALDRVGAGGPWPAAAQTLLFGAAATAGVLWVVWVEAGPGAMRQAATFVGLTPAAWTLATSSDATFSGLCVAAVVAAFAAERARRRAGQGPGAASGARAISLAAGAGALGALCCYFTYAAPLFIAPAGVPAYRLVRRRRFGVVLAAAGGACVVVAAFTAAGFAWWDGLAATVDAYRDGVASHRPYRYFVLANLAVFAVAVGPATLVGAPRRQPAGVAPVVALAVAGVLVADLTGLSKAEVERIWLPFVPWVALAAGPLARSGPEARRWLAAQLAVAVALQLTFHTPW